MDIRVLKQNGAIGPYYPTLTGLAYMGAAYMCVQGTKQLGTKISEKRNQKFSSEHLLKKSVDAHLVPGVRTDSCLLDSIGDITI